MKITLPNDAWAELRTAKEVPERLRRPVSKALLVMGKNKVQDLTDEQSIEPEVLDSFESLNDLLILARVKAWSFEGAITLENVLELPSDAYNALRVATATDMLEMMPDFSDSTDPDSPSNPFSD